LTPRCTTSSKTSLSLGDVATQLGYSYRHVRRLVARGVLHAENVGDTGRGPTWRVSRTELDRFRAARNA
jgi:excisionase family DNA binding protein